MCFTSLGWCSNWDLIHALVMLQLDYRNLADEGGDMLHLNTAQKLKTAQNAVGRALTETGHQEQNLSNIEYWLLVHFRVQFKLLALSYNALYCLGPR